MANDATASETTGSLDGLVLLFNTCAAPSLAARLHARSCSMVRTSSRIGGRRVKLIEGPDLQYIIDDLNEREFPVKRCSCCKNERTQAS